jgi:hypothetical protein
LALTKGRSEMLTQRRGAREDGSKRGRIEVARPITGTEASAR